MSSAPPFGDEEEEEEEYEDFEVVLNKKSADADLGFVSRSNSVLWHPRASVHGAGWSYSIVVVLDFLDLQ